MLKVLQNRTTGKEKTYDLINKQNGNQALVDNFVDCYISEGYTQNHWFTNNIFASYHTVIGYQLCNILLVTEEKYSRTTSTIQNKLVRAFESSNHKVYEVPQEVLNHLVFDEDDYDFWEVANFLESCLLEGKDKLDYDDHKHILSL